MGAVAQSKRSSGTLRGRVSAGVAWGMLFSVVTQVTRVAVGLVLARLLTPADYGLAGMALVCVTFVAALSDASLGKALVQRATIDELDRSTVFWASVAIGVVLTCGGVAASGLLAQLFHQPKLQPLVAVLSIGFVLFSLQITQASLFQRDMVFKPTTVRLILSAAVGGTVGILVAMLGGGAWALIAQQLALTATSALLLWLLSPWRPKLMFSWSRLRSLAGFGLNVMGSQFMADVSTNADNFLIGRFLGSTALGTYSVAYNLMTLPASRLVLPIQETLFPAYARIQDETGRVKQIWLSTTAVVTSVVAPAMLGLMIVAPGFVHVVLGSRWAAAAPVLRILAPLAVAQSLGALAATTLVARDRAKTVFRFSVVNTVIVVAAFIIGLHWGIIGVAAAFACVSIPASGVLVYLAAHALGAAASELVSTLRGPFEATVAMCLAALGAQWLLQWQSVSIGVTLVIVIAAAAAVYVPICLFRVAAVRSELIRLRRRRAVVAIAEPVGVVPAD